MGNCTDLPTHVLTQDCPHLQIGTIPVKVVVREESDRVNDISATGSIRRRRQQDYRFAVLEPSFQRSPW